MPYIYHASVKQLMYNVNISQNDFYFQCDSLINHPGQVPGFTDDVTGYLDTVFTPLLPALSNDWGTVYYDISLVVPGVGESLIASPVYIRTGTESNENLPSQNSVYVRASGFMHPGRPKKYFAGTTIGTFVDGVIIAGYKSLYQAAGEAWISLYEGGDFIFTPGWVSTAEVNGEPPTVPYFVPFAPGSIVVNDFATTLSKRKTGRGI